MNFEYNENNNSWSKSSDARVESLSHRWWNPNYKKTIIILLVLIVIIGIFLAAFLSFNSKIDLENHNATRTLKFTSILFRHGDRTPTGTYNSDPYKNYSWPDGYGQLTNLGKRQLYNLGKTLRKRYSQFLPNNYSESDIYVQSSDRSRTLMSAYTLLAGLYPPVPEQVWNPEIMWQPIPVHSIPRENDSIIAQKQSCPYYDQYFEKIKNSTDVRKINDKFKDVYEILTKYCNETVNTLLRVEFIYSHMEIERSNGLILPDWTKQVFPDKMEEIAGLSLALFTYDDIMMRLKGGPLLKHMIDNMKNKLEGKINPNRKMYLYSGHDLTIITLWRTLTFTEVFFPEFGAALVIELHEIPNNSTDSEIKLLYYNSSSTTEPYQLQMPNCGTPCTFSEFLKLTANHISSDWNKECEIKK